ncbi:MAG TPA: chloride channel protein [Gemmatimonadaceae bacterium]|nr:chloride channel protein [Gemmatimonadaceae bacterium]
MSDGEQAAVNRTGGLPVAPSLEPALQSVQAPPHYSPVDRRVIVISILAMGVGAGGALIAWILTRLIGLITNLSYFGRLSADFTAPSTERLGFWSILVPIAGAVIVGIMARYGAAAIRGHGIPEVMERVLYNRSRISPKIMFLKPLSAAIAIGTGGPFGAEGPIIATGGGLGSLIGQLIHVTADERKTLLAAGAAAGMAATFGSPVSAVLLAVELLLFEYRPRSVIPVALASSVAVGVRALLVGSAPVFTIPTLQQPTMEALLAYVVLGAIIGVFAAGTTWFVYWIEDVYEELPIHWMWWPAVGAVFVGVIGLLDQRTLGVGYINIDHILGGDLIGWTLLVLVVLKFLSWAIYLGSGTSGGTLAPLFTVGGGLGALLGGMAASLAPSVGIDVHVAALVGMAAIFAGASHAMLAAVIFAFETTRQPMGLLPILAGSSTAYLIALFLMRSSIMTEKLARRGTPVRTEYMADFLDRVQVRDAITREVATIAASQTLGEVRAWLGTRTAPTVHQAFPVVDGDGALIGVVNRYELLDTKSDNAVLVRELVLSAPAVVYEENTLREAADHMVRAKVGRLPVVLRDDPRRVVGIISRSDLLSAHAGRLDAAMVTESPPIGRGWLRRQEKRRRSKEVR